MLQFRNAPVLNFHTLERTHIPRRPCFVLLYLKSEMEFEVEILERVSRSCSAETDFIYMQLDPMPTSLHFSSSSSKDSQSLTPFPFLGPSPRCKHFSWGLSYILRSYIYTFLHDGYDDDEVETGLEF